METSGDSKFRILGISKLKAALIYITKVSGDKWDFDSLLNKMYLVQKEHLVRYGKPFVNEYFSAGEMGTGVHLSVFTVEKTGEGGNVFIGEAPDMDELSAEEKSILLQQPNKSPFVWRIVRQARQ